jgi:hypothetical protein
MGLQPIYPQFSQGKALTTKITKNFTSDKEKQELPIFGAQKQWLHSKGGSHSFKRSFHFKYTTKRKAAITGSYGSNI